MLRTSKLDELDGSCIFLYTIVALLCAICSFIQPFVQKGEKDEIVNANYSGEAGHFQPELGLLLVYADLTPTVTRERHITTTNTSSGSQQEPYSRINRPTEP